MYIKEYIPSRSRPYQPTAQPRIASLFIHRSPRSGGTAPGFTTFFPGSLRGSATGLGNPVSPSVYELYSFQALSDPKGTTNYEEHGEAMKRHRLDRHTA